MRPPRAPHRPHGIPYRAARSPLPELVARCAHPTGATWKVRGAWAEVDGETAEYLRAAFAVEVRETAAAGAVAGVGSTGDGGDVASPRLAWRRGIFEIEHRVLSYDSACGRVDRVGEWRHLGRRNVYGWRRGGYGVPLAWVGEDGVVIEDGGEWANPRPEPYLYHLATGEAVSRPWRPSLARAKRLVDALEAAVPELGRCREPDRELTGERQEAAREAVAEAR